MTRATIKVMLEQTPTTLKKQPSFRGKAGSPSGDGFEMTKSSPSGLAGVPVPSPREGIRKFAEDDRPT